jgi:hypothetical protein
MQLVKQQKILEETHFRAVEFSEDAQLSWKMRVAMERGEAVEQQPGHKHVVSI